MPEPIRVRDDVTGAEYSTYAVNEKGETYEGLTVLKDEPAVDAHGVLIPPKYREPVKKAEAPKPAKPATTTRPATTEEH